MNDNTSDSGTAITEDERFGSHELPFAWLMDCIGRARLRLAEAAPEAAVAIAEEFGALEDAAAMLATDLATAGWDKPEALPQSRRQLH